MQTFKITIDDRDFIVLCLPNRPKALLDRTVAEIYEVTTMRVNEAVRRNPEKFPEDFYFELTLEETRDLNDIANCDIDWKGGHLPKAFTHLGCNMLATVLKSKRAVQRAIQIIRTFTALESGGFSGIVEELRLGQKRLRKEFEDFRNQQERETVALKENLHFLLWEGQSENSPVIQIQRQIASLEEKITTLFLDGRFRRLQLSEIYSDITKLRKYVEEEVGQVWEDNRNLDQRVFYQEDRLSRIGREIEKLEEKVGALLKEKKSPPKELSLPSSGSQRISPERAETLRFLVHQKARGKRKKIMKDLGGF